MVASMSSMVVVALVCLDFVRRTSGHHVIAGIASGVVVVMRTSCGQVKDLRQNDRDAKGCVGE